MGLVVPEDLIDEDEGAVGRILGIAQGPRHLHPNVAPLLHHPAKVFSDRLSFVQDWKKKLINHNEEEKKYLRNSSSLNSWLGM